MNLNQKRKIHLIYLTIEDNISFEEIFKPIENIETKKNEINKQNRINFIEYYINYDDTIETLKKKIFAYLNIYSIFQHIFTESEEGTIKPLGYNIYGVKEIDQDYKINIARLFNEADPLTLGLNVPIDKTLVNKLKSESYSLLWFNKQRLWETNIYLNNTLYVVDFKNIYSKMNILKLEQIINNEDSFHLFYKGFLSKYFPYVTYLHLKKFLESGKLNEEKKLITQDLMNEQYYLELIKNIKKEDINIKLKHTSLISTNIHVNYYMPPNFIEMRGYI